MGRRWHHRADATICGINHIVVAAATPRVNFIQSVLKPLDPDAATLPFPKTSFPPEWRFFTGEKYAADLAVYSPLGHSYLGFNSRQSRRMRC